LYPVLFAALTAGAADAIDYPVVGTQLLLRSPPAGARGALSLVLKDPSVPVPVPGSPDDPSGEIVQIFVFGHASGEVSTFYTIPNPGQWDVRSTPKAVTYGYVNRTASPLCCDLSRVNFRTESGLKLHAKNGGLNLSAPEGGVGVRVEWGSVRVCAIFDGDAIRQDANYRFVARNADAPGIADCDDDTLNGP
jgi:hypothetical protein